MQIARPLFATDPKLFGKGRVRDVPGRGTARKATRSDLALFATTFVAGFLVTSILIA